jgi:cell division ATPase FtsA
MALFIDGKILNSFVFPFGGDDLTQILQDNLKILFDEAEEIKIKYGFVAKSEITNLLLPKVEAVLEDMYKKLEPFLKNKKSLPQLSVAGGVAKMDGFIEIIEDVFKIPINIGSLKCGGKISDITFACSLGLMKYGAKKIIAARSGVSMTEPIGFARRFISKIKSIISEYF